MGNAKHSVTLTKYHTMEHNGAAYDSATQLFDTDITTPDADAGANHGTIGQEAQSGLSRRARH